MDGIPVLHVLDLVRSSLIIASNTTLERKYVRFDIPLIHCISKLRLAGIKVSPAKKALNLLEVKFKRGLIEMPNITIDDLMRCLLLNCVAFEQCHQRSKKDVEYLRERNVIDNYLGNDLEIGYFINRAGKDSVLNDFYLGELFEEVDRHYRTRWKWKWASFERECFDKPWLLLSAAGGILLVVATSIQAVMGILTYKYKNC